MKCDLPVIAILLNPCSQKILDTTWEIWHLKNYAIIYNFGSPA